MAAAQINPFDQFFGADGAPLTGGYIYIGQANADPRQFPITAYYDAALTIPAVQPLRTNAGYITRNGAPALIYLNADYSLLVTDKKGVQVFYIASYSAVSGVPSTPFVEQTYQAFTTSGAAPAYVLTPTPAITQYKINQRFNATFNAAGTTGSNTLNINGLGIKNLKQYDSAGVKQPAVVANGMIADVIYDGTDQVVIDALPATPYTPPVPIAMRQAPQFGPFNAVVPPNSALIPTSQIGNTVAAGVTLKCSSAPTLFSVANGFNADGSQLDLNWLATADIVVANLTPSTTNYLWVDVVAKTAGFVTVADSDQPGGVIPITNNQYTFDYVGYKNYLGNGAAAVQTNRLIIAEVDTSATVVAAVRNRQYKATYESALTASATSFETSFNHNVGSINTSISTEIECVTADLGYAVGNRRPWNTTTNGTGSFGAPGALLSRNTAQFAVNGGWDLIPTRGTTSGALTTQASWRGRLRAKRNW